MSKTLDTRAAAKPNIAAPPAHDHGQDANSRMLLLALLLTGTFLIAEEIGSLVFNSLALLSDDGHMMTDVVGLTNALTRIRIGARPPQEQQLLGYKPDTNQAPPVHNGKR